MEFNSKEKQYILNIYKDAHCDCKQLSDATYRHDIIVNNKCIAISFYGEAKAWRWAASTIKNKIMHNLTQ
jgi:hypothetical protein